ncbi:MAG: TRAP transporter small permease [Defluviicoccus sp.]|nr:TRAP transporter small permease [Defluviicoccus sp.]MDE0386550.1 TRAP transporter small permease [Defluviicoccus sp.]
MGIVAAAYKRLIHGLAVLGAAILAFVFAGIVVDVSLRTAGFQPLQWYSALTEYSLLFATMLGGPWLVRVKGHVVVESLMLAMPPALRLASAKFSYALCIVLSALFVWYGADKAVAAWIAGEIDIRSIDMPRWVLYASFPLGFGLMAVEFARYLLGFDSYYSGQAGKSETL